MPAATASSSWPRRPAERDMVDRRILRRDLDRDRIDVGGDRPRGGPQPQRGEGEQAGAGADVGEIGDARARRPQPVERDQAAGGGLVLAGAEGAAGVDLEARPRRPGPSRDARACGRRSARRGSAPARPGSASPNPASSSFSTFGRGAARARRQGEQQVDVGAARARPRNRRPSATRSPSASLVISTGGESSIASWAISPFSASASARGAGQG